MVEQIHESLNQNYLKEIIYSGDECLVVIVCLNDVYFHLILWVTYLGLLCALLLRLLCNCAVNLIQKPVL